MFTYLNPNGQNPHLAFLEKLVQSDQKQVKTFEKVSPVPNSHRTQSPTRDYLSAIPDFHFQQRNERINWREIHNIDLDQVVHEVDIDSLQRLLKNIAFGDLESADLERLSEEAYVKLFKLSQLTIEYLLYSQNTLQHQIRAAEAETAGLMKDQNRLEQKISQKERDVEKLRKEIGLKNRTILNYEYLFRCGGTVALTSKSVISKCPVCEKLFKGAQFLKSHLERKHPDNSVDPAIFESSTDAIEQGIYAQSAETDILTNKTAEKVRDEVRKEFEDRYEHMKAVNENRFSEIKSAYEAQINQMKTSHLEKLEDVYKQNMEVSRLQRAHESQLEDQHKENRLQIDSLRNEFRNVMYTFGGTGDSPRDGVATFSPQRVEVGGGVKGSPLGKSESTRDQNQRAYMAALQRRNSQKLKRSDSARSERDEMEQIIKSEAESRNESREPSPLKEKVSANEIEVREINIDQKKTSQSVESAPQRLGQDEETKTSVEKISPKKMDKNVENDNNEIQKVKEEAKIEEPEFVDSPRVEDNGLIGKDPTIHEMIPIQGGRKKLVYDNNTEENEAEGVGSRPGSSYSLMRLSDGFKKMKEEKKMTEYGDEKVDQERARIEESIEKQFKDEYNVDLADIEQIKALTLDDMEKIDGRINEKVFRNEIDDEYLEIKQVTEAEIDRLVHQALRTSSDSPTPVVESFTKARKETKTTGHAVDESLSASEYLIKTEGASLPGGRRESEVLKEINEKEADVISEAQRALQEEEERKRKKEEEIEEQEIEDEKRRQEVIRSQFRRDSETRFLSPQRSNSMRKSSSNLSDQIREATNSDERKNRFLNSPKGGANIMSSSVTSFKQSPGGRSRSGSMTRTRTTDLISKIQNDDDDEDDYSGDYSSTNFGSLKPASAKNAGSGIPLGNSKFSRPGIGSGQVQTRAGWKNSPSSRTFSNNPGSRQTNQYSPVIKTGQALDFTADDEEF